MTPRLSERTIRVLLLFGSILVALALAEVAVRIFLPANAGWKRNPVNSGNYFCRYLIDGKPAASIDYFVRDPQLPFTLKPGYHHIIVDLAYHPVPFSVNLDDFGYRNQQRGNKYDLVVVGDSVAFGYGVNDEETIAAQFGKLTNAYSLAIPGAGPEMYMVMLERFLSRAKTSRVVILFYEGNDYMNLYNAYWPELATCSPPGQSRVVRKDTPLPSEEDAKSGGFPLVAQLAKDVIERHFNGRPLTPGELLGTYDQISGAAIADLNNYEDQERKLHENIPKALSILQQLKVETCVGATEREGMEALSQSIQEKKIGHLADSMRSISLSLAVKNCYPIGVGYPDEKVGESLLIAANYYAGYYYNYVSSLKNGYSGNILNFQVLLDQLETRQELSPERERIRTLKKMLVDRREVQSVSALSDQLRSSLSKLAATYVSPENCDKEALFVDYLASLRDRNIEVVVIALPSEYQLLHSSGGGGRICRMVAAKGMKSLDLYPRLAALYRAPGANGLYLDGAHFTAEGSAKVAEWMAVELGLNPADSGQH